MKNLYLIIMLVVAFTIVKAQDPYALHINKANGLPSNSVYNVFQDSKGFIWLTSTVGLTRYDGFEFKTYQCNEQTSTPGSSIKEDSFGRIWYENFDGYLYYIENDTLKALKQNIPIGYIPIGITKRHLFILQKEGVDVYDLKTLQKTKTIKISALNTHHSSSNKNVFYCIINYTIYKIDDNLNMTSSDFLKNKSELTTQIYCTQNSVYVVGKHNEQKSCYVFDTKLNYLKTICISEPEFIQGSDQINNKIWIHSSKGTFAYNESLKGNTSIYFKDKSISCVIKDRQNNYWFSTTNEGIYLVPNINNSSYSLNGYLPNKIVETNDAYFIATKKSELIRCDKSFNINSLINQKKDNAEIYYLNYDSTNNSLFYSSKGFTNIPNLKYKTNTKFYDIAVKEISKIDDSYYAIATSGFCGIMSIENSSYSTKSLWDSYFEKNKKLRFPNMAHIINNVRGKSLAFNNATHTLYFATNIGLYKCTTTEINEIKLNNESFYATKLIFFKDNVYALSTKGNLYQISNDNQFVLLNKTFDIQDLEIKLIKQFGNKLVFVSQKSVHLLDLETKKMTTIDININTFEINDILLKENTLFLITDKGIIKTSIENESHKKNGAILQLNELIVNDERFNPTLKNYLKYNQNDIIIHFSLLDFGSSNQNLLYYQINDNAWQSIINETRTIQFASLASGNYKIVFKINNHVLSTKLEFNIANPFWKTWWFIAICLSFIILMGYTYYRWQLNKLKLKNKLLEDKNILLQEKIELEHHLNKSVLTSIKSQMNPHFFYNALNTIQAYIFINDKTKANNYLAKFSKLTRVILEQSEKETISLGEEIESLTLYLELEKMRFDENFEYTIKSNTHAHKDSIELPPMLVQPYVENAIKHGLLHNETTKQLNIIFEENNNHLIITIDDNGIGRKKSSELNKIKNEKYQSFSTQANEKRLEILNRNNDKIAVKIIDKFDNAEKAIGTKVILTIPIN